MAKVSKKTKWATNQILASATGLHLFTQLFPLAGAPAADANGRRIYKSGSAFPANDGTGIGVVYNDVDVTDGDVEDSLMQGGWLLPGTLPAVLSADFLAANPGIHLRKFPTT